MVRTEDRYAGQKPGRTRKGQTVHHIRQDEEYVWLVDGRDRDHGETQEKEEETYTGDMHRIPEAVKKMLESGETLSDEMIIQAIQSDRKN